MLRREEQVWRARVKRCIPGVKRYICGEVGLGRFS